jgi:hypothetical protein
MTEKIQKYVNRSRRLMKKYPNPNDFFFENELPIDKWNVKDLIFWLDWNAIPVVSMSSADNLELKLELQNMIDQFYQNQQLEMF